MLIPANFTRFHRWQTQFIQGFKHGGQAFTLLFGYTQALFQRRLLLFIRLTTAGVLLLLTQQGALRLTGRLFGFFQQVLPFDLVPGKHGFVPVLVVAHFVTVGVGMANARFEIFNIALQ